MTAAPAVDFALVNEETHEVLRTSPDMFTLIAIARRMEAQREALGGVGIVYIVKPMRRAEMGDAMYAQALDVRWRQIQRRTPAIRAERELAHRRLSLQRSSS